MKRYLHSLSLLVAIASLLLTSCVHHPDVPVASRETGCLPAIYPDYCDVTVPCNIAPLNFMLPADEYSECVARITTPDGRQQTYGKGVKVLIPEDEWHSMLDASRGDSLMVEVWGKKGEEWLLFNPFQIHVAAEPIDEYVSYRLLEPTYVAWNYMEIAQRDITTFDESQIFNNEVTMNDKKGQCINCHSYQNYRTDNMLFHVRLSNAATVLVNDGKVSLKNLKRKYTISGGVYPAWHPSAKIIAFSTNTTRQAFHTANHNKIEVYDEASDLIVYDIATDSVIVVSEDPELLEVYPTWSPDGQYLYYCKTVPLPEELRGKDIRSTYQKVQYNLYRRTFEQETLSFGDEELVYDAAAQDKSVTLPRVSPDGQYILFAEGQYGCFHIRHSDGQIVCMSLDDMAEKTGVLDVEKGNALCTEKEDALCVDKEEIPSFIDMSNLNSEGFADSYPSWSSNGHWIMCSSRRGDGNYSRLYFSYFHNGKVEKAFMLPQEDPEHNLYRLLCYNRPEFMVEPVRISVREFSRVFPK